MQGPAVSRLRPDRHLEPFLAMEIFERAVALERAGASVVHLEVGEPDGAPPEAALAAAHAALDAGATRYTDSRGLAELREAVADDAMQRFGAVVSPERVLVTGGSSPGLLLVFSLLAGPGDEVIVPTPHYPCYPNAIVYAGATPVLVPTRPERGHAIDPAAVAAACNERTRAIVVNSPANPTGAVQSRETLAALAELGVPLVSDEIYDGLRYDGRPPVSALQLGRGEAFVLDGVSKRYAMTGFRIGWVIAPEWAGRPLQIAHQNLFISAGEFAQRAAIAALLHGGEEARARCARYQRRRDSLVAGLRALGFGVPEAPAGAFYVLADARRFGADSHALAFAILERAHVGVTPGIDFGAAAEGHLRFCYAVADEAIDEALERLARVLPELAA